MSRIGLPILLRADIPVACPVLDVHPKRLRSPWPETMRQLGQECILEHVGMLRPEFMRQANKSEQQGLAAIGTAMIVNLDTGANPARHTP